MRVTNVKPERTGLDTLVLCATAGARHEHTDPRVSAPVEHARR